MLWVIKENLRQTLFILFIGINSVLTAQSIDIEELKIKGHIGYSVTLNELKSSGIDIDSIKAVPEMMDMSIADSLVYIGGTYYELYNKSNKCLLKVIIFDDRITKVEIGDLKLNKQTTIESLQSYFSEDCQTTGETKIYQDLNTYRTCSIPINFSGQLTDSRLIFFFSDGKLKRIDIWNPS